jgi:oxygen-dependent protoporphyrinogen oxidase
VRHIAVIGAGVAGLTAAFRRSLAGDRVSVFEATPRLGGQLHTQRSDGFVIEHGAEGFIAGSRALAELAEALGIASQLLDQRVQDSCHFDGRRLVTLAPGEAGRLLGFQVGSRAFGKGIQSFSEGMSQLVNALSGCLAPRARCVVGTPIQALRRATPGWELVLGAGASERVDAVIVATSAAAAAPLLEQPFGPHAAALAESEALSSVSVSLAYPRDHILHPLEATGFVVAEAAQAEGFRACTFASSKLSGRAPEHRALLRLFFRPSPEDLSRASDAEWTARAERCARRALDIQGTAEHAWVSRWDRALPVFDSAHQQRIGALEAQLRGSGISLAGAAFHGSGIDGAVRSAEAAARALDPALPA